MWICVSLLLLPLNQQPSIRHIRRCSFILVRFYAWNMLPTSKRLLIWFDQNLTCIAPPMLNSNQYHVICLSLNANKEFIYLLLCTVTIVPNRHCLYLKYFDFSMFRRLSITKWQNHGPNGCIRFYLKFKNNDFEFDSSINRVTHGQIMPDEWNPIMNQQLHAKTRLCLNHE